MYFLLYLIQVSDSPQPQMVKKVVPAVAQETMKTEPENKAKGNRISCLRTQTVCKYDIIVSCTDLRL